MRVISSMLGGFFVVASCLAAGPSGLQREPGTLYLEDYGIPALTVAVRPGADAYFDLEMRRYLGTLRVPQEVSLLAVADDAFRIRGMAQQGQIAGWVPPSALAELPEDWLAKVRAHAERQRRVARLIENRQVALGMTPDEVRRSLGRPEKESFRADSGGRVDLWEYITYKHIPQTRTLFDRFNRPYQDVIYVKVPEGRMAVEFENGLVSVVEKTEGTLIEGGASVVVPPVEIRY